MEEFEDRINEENRTTIEERHQQRRREREDRRRRKRNQQYCSQLGHKSGHPILDYLLLPFLEGCANSLTDSIIQRSNENMVNPLVIINRHRDTAIPTEVIEPSAETQNIPDPIKAPRQYSNPFPVNSHIRNLAQGMNASAEKQATAQEHGVTLKEGQTWVKDYVKGASKDRQ